MPAARPFAAGRPFAACACLLAVVLAGCAEAPAVPDGATEARDDALPGLVLHAWAEPRDDGTGVLLRAVLRNDGDRFYDHRAECGHPWNSTLLDAAGRTVHARLVEPCQDFFYERLAPGHHLEFRHTWDLHDHGEPDAVNGTQSPGEAPGKRGADGRAPVRVPAGTYTWSLAATVIGPRAGELRVGVPIEVPAARAAPADGPAAPS